jgi:hypothetical protein
MQTVSTAFVMDLPTIEKLHPGLAGGNLSRLQRFKIRTATSLGPPELGQIYGGKVYELTVKVSIIPCFNLYGLLILFTSILF